MQSTKCLKHVFQYSNGDCQWVTVDGFLSDYLCLTACAVLVEKKNSVGENVKFATVFPNISQIICLFYVV